MREPTQQEAACFIYDTMPTERNARLALEQLQAAGLEPVVDAEAKVPKPFALATVKIDKEPWRFKRLEYVALHDDTASENESDHASDHARDANVSQRAGRDAHQDDRAIDISSDDDHHHHREINVVAAATSNADPMFAPSQTLAIDLIAHIFIDNNIKGVSHYKFIDSNAVYHILSPYFKPGTLKNGSLRSWMGRSCRWGKAKTLLHCGQTKSGRHYNIVKKEYRDFKWTPCMEEFRQRILNMAFTHVTVGLVPNVPNSLSAAAKKKATELLAFRLRHKLLCQNVFATSPSGASGIDGNVLDLVQLLQKQHRKVRLVAIDLADQFDSIVQLKAFLTANSCLDEIVMDLGEQVDIYKRRDLKNDMKLVKLLHGRHPETT
ncbi:hypothetical protein BC940DRAFT_337760 [Gongronella butleri]|nr:hypothetical protein BC940DRAFT_337760 [Gongronella butleri]